MSRKLPPGVVRHGDKFRYRLTVDGKRRNSRVFDTPEQAYAALEQARKVVALTTKRVTLADGFQRVLDRGGIRQGTVDQYEEKHKILAREIGDDTGLLAITEDRLLDYVKKREATVSAATITKELVMLNRIFRVCEDDGLIDVNPVPRFRRKYSGRLRTRKRPPKWVSPEEFDEVYARMLAWEPQRGTAADLERDRLIPLTLYHTGLRRAELGRLRVEDVDLSAAVIHVDGKTGDATVPISRRLLPVLARYIEGRTGLAVGTTDDVARSFRRWQQRLGIDWTPHMMRHGLGSLLAKTKAHSSVIQAALRHRTQEMASHYQSVALDAVRAAINEAFG